MYSFVVVSLQKRANNLGVISGYGGESDRLFQSICHLETKSRDLAKCKRTLAFFVQRFASAVGHEQLAGKSGSLPNCLNYCVMVL